MVLIEGAFHSLVGEGEGGGGFFGEVLHLFCEFVGPRNTGRSFMKWKKRSLGILTIVEKEGRVAGGRIDFVVNGELAHDNHSAQSC